MWIPPSGVTNSANPYSIFSATLTHVGPYGGDAFEAYFCPSGTYEYFDGSTWNWQKYAGWMFNTYDETATFTWAKSVSNGSTSSSLILIGDPYNYSFKIKGTITYTLKWTQTISNVNIGDPITKEQFDAIGWSATKGSSISHSGQSGIIYASTYNNLTIPHNLGTTSITLSERS